MSGVADLVAQILQALKECEEIQGKCCCIAQLDIHGHGRPGFQRVGPNPREGAIDDPAYMPGVMHYVGEDGKLRSNISALGALRGKFCDNARINFWGCAVGGGERGFGFLRAIHEELGVVVAGSDRNNTAVCTPEATVLGHKGVPSEFVVYPDDTRPSADCCPKKKEVK